MDKYRGLYIHIPFCVKKCLYCDFVSFSGCENMFDRYIDALLREAEKYRNAKFETVFFGGGTPSVLSVQQLDRLLSGLEKIFLFTDNAEATLEANPKTLTDEKLRMLKNHIINRISVGVQSFNDKELQALGRIHTSREALGTIENVSSYFDNFNIDIMMSVPHQTENSMMNTLETAVSTGAPHLSCYSLIIEEGTPFFDMYENGELQTPSDDKDREMYKSLKAFLQNKGYNRYEISNFAKNGYECRHNLKYWTTNEYIGLGVAAHSYAAGTRYSNTTDIDSYLSGTEPEYEILSENDKISEYIMMSLRTTNGLDENEFFERFGKSFYNMNKNKLDLYMDKGFVRKTENGFAFTDMGFDVSNAILCEII